MSEKRSKVSVIKEFFEMEPREVMEQWKKLTDADKIELAQGAAKMLGLTSEQVDFELV